MPWAVRSSISSTDTPSLLRPLRVHGAGALGTGRARVDDVDVDAVRAQLVGERLGHVHERQIAHAAVGARVAGRHPADVYDTPPALFAHDGRHRLGAAHVTHHLGVQVGEQVLVAGVVQAAAYQAARIGGIVHEDVDPAELGHRGVHQPLHRLVAGGVGGNGYDAPARLGRKLCGSLLEQALSPGADDHADALACELAGYRLSDAHAAARHYGDFAV